VTGKVGTVTIAGAVGADGRPWELKNATSVGSLTLGDVTNAVVTVAGDMGAVKAIRWLDGSIQAARVASITTSGVGGMHTKPAVSGDFRGDVTLTGTLKPVLGTLRLRRQTAGARIGGPARRGHVGASRSLGG
jgi:hypothetical protein